MSIYSVEMNNASNINHRDLTDSAFAGSLIMLKETCEQLNADIDDLRKEITSLHADIRWLSLGGIFVSVSLVIHTIWSVL